MSLFARIHIYQVHDGVPFGACYKKYQLALRNIDVAREYSSDICVTLSMDDDLVVVGFWSMNPRVVKSCPFVDSCLLVVMGRFRPHWNARAKGNEKKGS